MALCPYCFRDVPISKNNARGGSDNFAAHIAGCPDAPPEAKAAWRGGWPDYLQGGGSTARRKP